MNRCLPQASAPRSTWPSTSAADSAKRPCGLPTRTTRPPNVAASSPASRWRVCPSGIVGPVSASGLRERRQLAGGLVRRELADPSYVPLVAAERGREEHLDESGHVL